MKTRDEIERLEKTIGQLGAIHREISVLSKKSPNDAMNSFKLRMVNRVIRVANDVLGKAYIPIDEFTQFEDDEAPSTSDVVFVIAQYIEEIKRFQRDNIVGQGIRRVYVLNGAPSSIHADSKLRGVE